MGKKDLEKKLVAEIRELVNKMSENVRRIFKYGYRIWENSSDATRYEKLLFKKEYAIAYLQ